MIQLTKDFFMAADDNCYTVGRLRKNRGTKDSPLRDTKYYGTVAQAVSATIDRVMRLKVKTEEVTSLRQFVHEQDRLKAELQKLLAPIEGGGTMAEVGGRA